MLARPMRRRGRPSRNERNVVVLFFLLAFLPLVCVFPYLAAVNNPNENVRTYMTMAIVEEGTFAIDRFVNRYGWVNDMARVPEMKGVPSHYASVKSPLVSFAAVPVYWTMTKVAPLAGVKVPTDTTPAAEKVAWFRITTWMLRLFVVQLPCFAFVIFLERWLRRLTADVVLRLACVTAACLGTNYVAYTNIFASHALCGVFAFAGFALIHGELLRSRGDARRRRASVAFLAGLLVGGTVNLEYHALPMALVLSFYALSAFWRPKTLVAFGLGGTLNALVLMFFQWKAFGNPLTPGHKMVESAAFAAQHAQGLYGIVMPDPEALRALSFDLGFGFFSTSPFMVLGLFGVWVGLVFGYGSATERAQLRRATVVWSLAMAGTWAVSAGFLHWRGGWTVGPRYLAAAPPFFAFGAACALERLARVGRKTRAVTRGLAGGLALASVLTIGTVGFVYDTLPESFTRPFVQFALPMLRGGYLPHHVGEWIGWDGLAFGYVCVAALVLAPILVGLFFDHDRGRFFALRTGAFLVFALVAMLPAFDEPSRSEQTATGGHPDVRGFMTGWEPAGRDRITKAREEAERRGPRGPCYWYRLADLERKVGLLPEADRDERRATAPRSACPSRWTL